MPSPGDMLTLDYQWQLHTTLYGLGNGSAWIEYPQSVDGLGGPDAKTQDVTYNFGPGSYANPDYLDMRLITIPCILRSSSASTLGTALSGLTTNWAPRSTDTDLAFQLPGIKFYVMGRPRGAKADMSRIREKAIRVLLRFDCPDPTITYL